MSEKIYVLLRKNDGLHTGHGITSEKPSTETVSSFFEQGTTEDNEVSRKSASDKENGKIINFRSVDKAFNQSIAMYRDAVVSTVKISPMVSASVIAQQLGSYASEQGNKLDELCDGDIEVYEFNNDSIHTILKKNDEAIAAVNGAKYLPQIAVIGLISAYDAFLADLLRAIFTVRPELILTSDREVKFSDLTKYSSIEEVKESIISEEIEGVLRKSHHEQIVWMENKFSMTLRSDLEVWPEFVELCERRNLLTHTGGIVSSQYLNNCKNHKCKLKVGVGDRLVVDSNYLTTAIEIIDEIGTKLVHTLWRKFVGSERDRADSRLNDKGMNLIRIKKYKTAERVLHFAVGQKKHSSDLIRRMMCVNLANSIKLSERKSDASAVLKNDDWSATSPQFRICVAAINDEHDEVCKLMDLGQETIEITASDFRDWPVFRSIRDVDQIVRKFEEIYGEPLVKAPRLKINDAGDSDENELSESKSGTIH
ncbi:hypothetical protein [Planktotalea sp.]|uniref:hypothetical protein n=1 Tax=Planktotalea sp. TaxID=2029877 RepID=UPI003D6B4593